MVALPHARCALQAGSGELHDLILLDIMMPGIDGYTVLTRLRKQVPGTGYRNERYCNKDGTDRLSIDSQGA
jgi:CheY-like chemotaxis protein